MHTLRRLLPIARHHCKAPSWVTAIVVSRTGDTEVEMRLATREDPVKNKISVWVGEYNELMNCQVKDELVSQLIALNNKLNLLSPGLVHGDEERAEVQQRRESLYAEIKHHRAKGHEGKPCPAARQVYATRPALAWQANQSQKSDAQQD